PLKFPRRDLKILTQNFLGGPDLSITTDPLRSSGDAKAPVRDSDKERADEFYATGKLLGELGNFKNSIQKLEKAADLYSRSGEHKLFIKSLTLCLRMYAEMEDEKALRAVKDRLYDYVARQKIELNSGTYYTLALSSSYRGEFTKALEFLEK